MPVYSMTGYASGQLSPRHAAPAARRKARAQRAAWGWKSARSTAASSTCPSACPRSCAQHEPALRELLTAPPQTRQGRSARRRRRRGADGVREPTARTAAAAERRAGHRAQPGCPTPRALSVADVLRLAGGESGSRAATGADGLQQLAARGAGRPAGGARARRRAAGHHAAGHLQQLRELAEQARPLVPQLVEQQRTALPGALEGGHGAWPKAPPRPKRRRTAP